MAALLLCVMTVLCATARADFGDFAGDSDYDFSYDYDSGYDSDSGYDDDDDYYRSSSGGGSWDLRTFAILGVIMAVVLVGGRRKDEGNSGGKGSSTRTRPVRGEDDADDTNAALRPIGDYTKLDPDFSAPALCEKAANLYVQMQSGWTAKDIEPLRPYFTDALFTQMERSLQGYRKRGETNVVERIAVLSVTPLGFCQSGGQDQIRLRLLTRITDYTVKDSTRELVRGSRTREKFMTYEWDLLRPTGTKTAADGGTKRITCPACGAPLDVNASARCPYCGSVIRQQAQDWVICAIRGVKQETR